MEKQRATPFWDMWVDRVKLDTLVSNSLLNVSGKAERGIVYQTENAVSTTEEIYNRKFLVFL